MNSPPADTLRRAAEYVQAGKPHLARPLLIDVVRQNPNLEQGWLLLSQAVSVQQQKIDCLQRVLRINPANAEAQARLKQLLAPPPESVAPIAPPPARPSPERAVSAIASTADPLSTSTRVQSLPSNTQSSAASSEPERGSVPSRLTAASAQGHPDVEAMRVAVAQHPALKRSPKWRFKKSQQIVIVIMACLALASIVAVLALLLSPGAQPSDRPAAPAAVVATATPSFTSTPRPSPTTRKLPFTWTPTPTPQATATRSPTPFPTLNPTLLAQMDKIEEQVADLRGLSIEGDVPLVLIRREAVERTLRQMLIEQGYAATLADQARSLSALGLIKPTYDLFKYAMNGLIDNVGGFYIPWLKQLFVIGTRFGGVERFVFAHEFDHALTDQHFDISALGVYPDCLSNAQRCAAIEALVEGDATLLMQQWFQQYAGPQDYQDILRYRPPSQTLPEEFPPPYVSRDLEFPYVAGLQFVEFLHQRGNWAEVNQAYDNLPDSTEQILHPEKYLAGEQPIEVAAPPLTPALGAEWRLIDDDVLGEWTTYLVLNAGADLSAQIDEAEALQASRGWGGDHYQVYHSDALGQTVLAVEWVWDTARDATEFEQALVKYLNERFRGAQIDHGSADCWESNHETSCLFNLDGRNLWLLAPDVAILDKVLTAYPDFQ